VGYLRTSFYAKDQTSLPLDGLLRKAQHYARISPYHRHDMNLYGKWFSQSYHWN
jgi:hypothetical protein